MKTCPKCHERIPDDVLVCDCGHEFPVYESFIADSDTLLQTPDVPLPPQKVHERSISDNGVVMKECPKCHKRNPNEFTYCVSCHYEFPVPKTIFNKDFGFAKVSVGCVVALFSIVGVVASFIYILSAVSNTYLWRSSDPTCLSVDECYCHAPDLTIHNLPMRLFHLVVGLLVWGASVWTFITTKGFTSWRDLSALKKRGVAISALEGAGLAMFSVCAWLLSNLSCSSCTCH